MTTKRQALQAIEESIKDTDIDKGTIDCFACDGQGVTPVLLPSGADIPTCKVCVGTGLLYFTVERDEEPKEEKQWLSEYDDVFNKFLRWAACFMLTAGFTVAIFQELL